MRRNMAQYVVKWLPVLNMLVVKPPPLRGWVYFIVGTFGFLECVGHFRRKSIFKKFYQQQRLKQETIQEQKFMDLQGKQTSILESTQQQFILIFHCENKEKIKQFVGIIDGLDNYNIRKIVMLPNDDQMDKYYNQKAEYLIPKEASDLLEKNRLYLIHKQTDKLLFDCTADFQQSGMIKSMKLHMNKILDRRFRQMFKSK